jgi:dipeptidyl aminopeptidase/acylaminoacyl peptidase
MKKTIALALISVLFALLTGNSYAAPDHTYTFNDFINVKWVRDPRISPEGKQVAFVIERKNLKENSTKSSLWLLTLETGALRQLTPDSQSNSHPRWSPDGTSLAFNSNRDGKLQVWILPLKGGEPKKVTNLYAGAWDAEWAPDGKKLMFLSEMCLGCTTEKENRALLESREKNGVKATLFKTLPYRVFDHWREEKRSHLFTISAGGGMARDLTPGAYDIPPLDLGGARDYSFSPDSKELCYVTNTDESLAWSTNNDLFTVSSDGGAPERITDNKGNDSNPRYSPDGRFIAYAAMERPGFEADKRSIVIFDRRTRTRMTLTESIDRSVEEFEWSPDGKKIFFTAEDEGYCALYEVEVDSRKITQLTQKTYNTRINVSPEGKSLIFLRESMTRPPEIYALNLVSGSTKPLTSVNEREFSGIIMNPPEEFHFKAKDGMTIQGFLVKPPHFSPSNKYPLVYLIHGGPQGTWSDDFHQRWNTELFAAPGYIVAAVNFRGSKGFGQKFTDAVSTDWGGVPYSDIMTGIDHLLATYPFIDGSRLSAAGASYGGFMINWIMGHSNTFKTVICHSGVFNTAGMYGTTEELWFPEWEFGGTPYRNRENFERWSPQNHVNNFRTPCLVIHGEQDYRVPVSEGMQLFTALQRNNIPSEFLYFPDECHFVRKPQNLQIWYRTMLEWLEKWLMRPTASIH